MKYIRALVMSVVVLASASAFAEEQCFEVSKSPTEWSRTPEHLCLMMTRASSEAVITLKTGMLFSEQTVATFNLSLIERARCVDCNKDLFAIENPSNSVFNALRIRFDGTRDLVSSPQTEEGTVMIGDTKLYYRNIRD